MLLVVYRSHGGDGGGLADRGSRVDTTAFKRAVPKEKAFLLVLPQTMKLLPSSSTHIHVFISSLVVFILV